MINRVELSKPLARVRVKDDEAIDAAFTKFVREVGVLLPGTMGDKFHRIHRPSWVTGAMNPCDPVVYTVVTMMLPREEGHRKYNEAVDRDNMTAEIVRIQVRDFIEEMPSGEELLRQAGL